MLIRHPRQPHPHPRGHPRHPASPEGRLVRLQSRGGAFRRRDRAPAAGAEPGPRVLHHGRPQPGRRALRGGGPARGLRGDRAGGGYDPSLLRRADHLPRRGLPHPLRHGHGKRLPARPGPHRGFHAIHIPGGRVRRGQPQRRALPREGGRPVPAPRPSQPHARPGARRLAPIGQHHPPRRIG